MKTTLPTLDSLPRLAAVVVLVLTAGLCLAAGAADAKPALDLTGAVQSKQGQPVANASVFIYTAGPRVGTSPI